MERLSDIINSIKERITNPFVFSFILSWLVYNWQVSVAFLWNDHDRFNLIEFVNTTATGWKCWVYPFGAALFYTFAAPAAMNIIRAFNAWIISWGNDWVFKISKESNVSTEKYLQLREDLKKNSDTISEMINTESKRIQAHDETKKLLAETQDKLVKTELDYQEQVKTLTSSKKIAIDALESTLLTEKSSHERIHDPSIIGGDWNTHHGKVTIQGRNFIIENVIIGVINLFHYDLESNIQFVLIRLSNDATLPYSAFYNLNKVSSDHWIGKVDGEPAVFSRSID